MIIVVAPDDSVLESILFSVLVEVFHERGDVKRVREHELVTRKLNQVDFRRRALFVDDVLLDSGKQFIQIRFVSDGRRIVVPMDVRQLEDVEVVVVAHRVNIITQMVRIPFHRSASSQTENKHRGQYKF